MVTPAHTLGALAERFGLTLLGDPAVRIQRICTLEPGAPDGLAFVADRRLLPALATTAAAAVIVPADAAEACRNGLVADNPALAYARIAALFAPVEGPPWGIHPTAVVAPDVRLGADCAIGAHAVIEAGVVLGERVRIGAQSVIERGAQIGDDADIGALVWIGNGVRIGQRALILPAAAIGTRGFGNAPDQGRWHTVPQLGSVRIGDDVEIGAHTSVDRGAIEDTVIGDGVKIDNHCQIAHNVVIGEHTAIAAGVGIAGSAQIGAHCMLGGQVGVNGHIRIADRVIVNGGSKVLQSITEPGQYGSGAPLLPVARWRRLMAVLGKLEHRLKRIERG